MHSADEKCVVSKFISIFQVNRHTETVSWMTLVLDNVMPMAWLKGQP